MSREKLLAVALVLFVTVLACGRSRQGDNMPAGSLAPAETPYHNVKPPEEYFGLVPFDLAGLSDFNPEYHIPPSDENDYQAALAKLRAKGLEALSDEELSLIVAVSWYAYVMQAETITYRLMETDASSKVQSDVVVEERYRFEKVGDFLAPVLVGSHWTEQEGSGQRADPSSANPPADEAIELYESTNADTDAENTVLTRWERQGTQWNCQRGAAGAGPVWAAMSHFYPDVGFVYAQPMGTEVIEGRPAYKLRAAAVSHGWFGQPELYWLDTETLLPIQYEYRKTGPEWADEEGNTLRFTILEVNGKVDIQPPDVNILCVEKDFEP